MCVRFEPVNNNFFNMHDDRIISCCGTIVDGEEQRSITNQIIEIVRQYLLASGTIFIQPCSVDRIKVWSIISH